MDSEHGMILPKKESFNSGILLFLENIMEEDFSIEIFIFYLQCQGSSSIRLLLFLDSILSFF